MSTYPGTHSRRKFILTLSGLAAGGLSIPAIISICASEAQKESIETKKKQYAGRLGIALVGLGKYSSGQLAPALQKTEQCYLAGIVSGSPEKVTQWKMQYDIPDKNVYNYENFDSIKDNPDIHIVYIVLPNALHADFTIRAAKAGKHVICETPMATLTGDCERMISACKKAGVMLSVGYRLHFEPYNKEMTRLATRKFFGPVKKIIAKNGTTEAEGWRLDKKLAGGGSLIDTGIYCVQAARYLIGMEPVAVKVQEGFGTRRGKLKDIEQSVAWQMEFPGGITADCECSYTTDMNLLHANAESGWFELTPAYGCKGIRGRTSLGKLNYPEVVQQAGQMDEIAKAIKDKRPSPVPGETGKQDLKILKAIYKAMESGRKVTIV